MHTRLTLYLCVVAFLISLLVHEATHARDRDEQREALCALKRLVTLFGSSSGSSSPSSGDKSAQQPTPTAEVDEILNFFAFCFPGIASACAVLTASDYKVGHAVICESLAILEQSICLLFANDDGDNDGSDNRISIDSLRSRLDSKTTAANGERNVADDSSATSGDGPHNETYVRDRRSCEWRTQTLTNLRRLLANLYARSSTSTLATTATLADESATSAWRARLALVTLAARVLLRCGDALCSADVEPLAPMLDCLVAARYHAQPRVARCAARAVRLLAPSTYHASSSSSSPSSSSLSSSSADTDADGDDDWLLRSTTTTFRVGARTLLAISSIVADSVARAARLCANQYYISLCFDCCRCTVRCHD
jgi:hypothetical protein